MGPMPAPCSRHNAHTPHDLCPGTAPEFPWEPVETVSGRPSPRGAGSAYDLAVRRARELIEIADNGSLDHGGTVMAVWIGRATAALRELTRDA